MSAPDVRLFDPRHVCETDLKLAAAVFESLACGLEPVTIAAARREHMRREINVRLAAWQSPRGMLPR